ncbi:MerR family DNA-binding transcriptional regulator [Kibdelosporangium aridum]|uniref:MerR family DNA-binding transcriptional regulator n=2 Tax=Kibdelosporangium aridum TaxID=2030 RepID=A0A428ZB83_KIBAR|nr:MerR family DNA-binding transcriptional regulator [Kibdelosporangium aridum]
MQIGEVAERTGLSLRTIRYYEEVGLAVPSARSQGGFRLYTQSELDRLHLIMRMKPLGFQLEEMRELLEVLDPDHTTGKPLTASQRRARLREYTGTAEERCTKLRATLATAEEFADMLRTRLHTMQSTRSDQS